MATHPRWPARRNCPAGKLALRELATNLVYFGTHVFVYSIGDEDLQRQELRRVAAHHA